MDLRGLLGDELLEFCDYVEDALDGNVYITIMSRVSRRRSRLQAPPSGAPQILPAALYTTASPTRVSACKWTPWIQYIYMYKHC